MIAIAKRVVKLLIFTFYQLLFHIYSFKNASAKDAFYACHFIYFLQISAMLSISLFMIESVG